jgi:hypothetical protein
MPISVPLVLEKSIAVVERLDYIGTRATHPAGKPAGFDDDFDEPVGYTSGGERRSDAVVYLPPIKLPCQVETIQYGALQQDQSGTDPESMVTLVFHKRDMRRLNMFDPLTKQFMLKLEDRVPRIESYRIPNLVTVQFDAPGLYITQIRPGSFGFGDDGFDLFIVSLGMRQKAV